MTQFTRRKIVQGLSTVAATGPLFWVGDAAAQWTNQPASDRPSEAVAAVMLKQLSSNSFCLPWGATPRITEEEDFLAAIKAIHMKAALTNWGP